jgi:5-methylcytosine-specific restriction protein A
MITKNGRCDDHQLVAWASSVGKTPTERGYGAAWRKLRKSVLIRDNYLCKACEAKGIATPATDVDHIVNKARGGSDILSNLQSLCKECHRAKTIRERSE